MKWPGRPTTPRRAAAEESGSDVTGIAAPAGAEAAPLDFRDGDAERLKRGIASQVIAEHRRELRRLNSDIARLSVAATATGSLVEDLAADLGRELERVRAESAAWAEGPADR